MVLEGRYSIYHASAVKLRPLPTAEVTLSLLSCSRRCFCSWLSVVKTWEHIVHFFSPSLNPSTLPSLGSAQSQRERALLSSRGHLLMRTGYRSKWRTVVTGFFGFFYTHILPGVLHRVLLLFCHFLNVMFKSLSSSTKVLDSILSQEMYSQNTKWM